MAITVDSLRTLAKQRADMLSSNFVSATEWVSYLNYSWKELYDILVAKFEDYYTAELLFTLSSGNTYPLPADFYKMRGLDRSLSGTEYYQIRPFMFEDRNDRNRAALYRGAYPAVRYRILGNELLFTPEDCANGNYRLWYIPRANDLVNDTDTVDGVNGWEDYIVVDAAIKALNKEESDVSVLMAQKQALLARINDMANNRDAGEPERVTDTSRGDYFFDYGGS